MNYHIEIDGNPACEMGSFRVTPQGKRERPPLCGHGNSLVSAENERELIQTAYPKSVVAVVEGQCPAYVENEKARYEMLEDRIREEAEEASREALGRDECRDRNEDLAVAEYIDSQKEAQA